MNMSMNPVENYLYASGELKTLSMDDILDQTRRVRYTEIENDSWSYTDNRERFNPYIEEYE